MFVWSLKTSKRQFFSIVACLVVLVAVLITAAVWPSSEEASPTVASVAASNEEERLSFLRSLGYEVEEPYVEVSEVLIPDEFDEVFQKYNEVQQSANMDLEPYHVLNYPTDDEVSAHLYVYNDKVIGGDISSAALDGFMHGLTKLNREG